MNHKLLVLCISISLLSINLAITQAAQTDCPTSDASRFGVVEQLTWGLLYSADNMLRHSS